MKKMTSSKDVEKYLVTVVRKVVEGNESKLQGKAFVEADSHGVD